MSGGGSSRSFLRTAGDVAALRAIRGAAADGDALAEAFARVVLGSLAEPGDGVLGRAVAAIGAIELAELILGGVEADHLAAVVDDAGEPLDPRQAEAGLERWRPRIDQAAVVRAIEQAARVSARLVLPGDRSWPGGVDDLGVHAPLALWVRGSVSALADTSAAMALVGARAATSYGEQVAASASAGLCERGFTIVSGGAYGIDGMAHRSALRSGGTTVAFLAGGVDRFYPLGHESLLTEITARGAVISELPCGAAPTKWRFLQRNRLIAAASAATVVLEAGTRSGSLNTAGHASALGRPLGAVPGPVTSPASAGCHRLFREYDAVCVVDASQMAELAGGARRVHPALWEESTPSAGRGMDPDAVRILDALSTRVPRRLEEVATLAGLESARALGVLGTLEAIGSVMRHPDGWRVVAQG